MIIEAVLHIQTKNLNLNFCRKWSQCLMNFDLSFCQAFVCECVSISVRTGWSYHVSLKTMVWNLDCTRNTNTCLENGFFFLRNTVLLFKSKLSQVMLVAGALSRVSDKVKLCMAAEPQVLCHQKLIKPGDMLSHLQQYSLTSWKVKYPCSLSTFLRPSKALLKSGIF